MIVLNQLVFIIELVKHYIVYPFYQMQSREKILLNIKSETDKINFNSISITLNKI